MPDFVFIHFRIKQEQATNVGWQTVRTRQDFITIHIARARKNWSQNCAWYIAFSHLLLAEYEKLDYSYRHKLNAT